MNTKNSTSGFIYIEVKFLNNNLNNLLRKESCYRIEIIHLLLE